MSDVFQRLEEEVDRDGLAELLGLDVQTLIGLAGYGVMRVDDDETREELAAIVEALKGAVKRDVRELAARIRGLEDEIAA